MNSAAAAPRIVKVDQVWKINHSRKGNLTVKFLHDADLDKDEWVDAEIIDGIAHYISENNRSSGDTLEMRSSFVTLLEALPATEAGRAALAEERK